MTWIRWGGRIRTSSKPTTGSAGWLVYYYTECVAKRASRTRPDSGVVTLFDTLCNPAGETVFGAMKALFSRRELT
jgi:hypothetical protein